MARLLVYELTAEEIISRLKERPHPDKIYTNRAMINLMKKFRVEKRFDEFEQFVNSYEWSMSDMTETSRLVIVRMTLSMIPELSSLHEKLSAIQK